MLKKLLRFPSIPIASRLHYSVSDFRPLKKDLSNIQNSKHPNFWFVGKKVLAAAADEIDPTNKNTLDVCSLCVHPKYFRQGCPKLLDF